MISVNVQPVGKGHRLLRDPLFAEANRALEDVLQRTRENARGIQEGLAAINAGAAANSAAKRIEEAAQRIARGQDVDALLDDASRGQMRRDLDMAMRLRPALEAAVQIAARDFTQRRAIASIVVLDEDERGDYNALLCKEADLLAQLCRLERKRRATIDRLEREDISVSSLPSAGMPWLEPLEERGHTSIFFRDLLEAGVLSPGKAPEELGRELIEQAAREAARRREADERSRARAA